MRISGKYIYSSFFENIPCRKFWKIIPERKINAN